MVLDVVVEPDEPDGVKGCVFCGIVRGETPADVVLTDEAGVAFLDRRPLMPGHVLLVPHVHVATLPDLPLEQVGPFFRLAQRLARAIPLAMGAEGSFVAVNSVVSQSVPHLHVHVVPRRHDDRLFSRNLAWTRRPYRDDAERAATAEVIRAALRETASRQDG